MECGELPLAGATGALAYALSRTEFAEGFQVPRGFSRNQLDKSAAAFREIGPANPTKLFVKTIGKIRGDFSQNKRGAEAPLENCNGGTR